MKRKKPINRRNRKRAARRYETQFGEKADYIRQLPCCICHAPSPSDPHHVRSRGAGGTSRDLVPLCRKHHQELHQYGAQTFETVWGADLKAKAEQYEEWFNDNPQPLGF